MANKLDQPMVYQIRIKGHLGPRWTDWFGGMTVTLEDNGDTLLTDPVVEILGNSYSPARMLMC